MARPLPALRRTLDVMPSPAPDRPGLLLRDPFRYADVAVIVPPPLVSFLALFDGGHDELDLGAALARATGEIQVQDVVRHLVDSLSRAGLLEDEVFGRLRDERQEAFAKAEVREAVHAGSAYPAEARPLEETLRRYLDGDVGTRPASPAGLLGIAAPHVSLEGGWRSYRAAYGLLGPPLGQRTFVILGTSHYGEPDRFGLTRKPFLTPLGKATVDERIVGLLEEEGGEAAKREDYCHAVEHSIEFQVVFLQQVFGPALSIVPILCGPFRRGMGGRPEDDAGVARFLDALAGLCAREGEKLFWVLGVDLAHMGRRYGDAFAARAGAEPMRAVAERDRQRLARIAGGDADGFWDLLRENDDDLKWCGASPLYTFLRASPPLQGELLRYEQWNIDAESVVSFAGLAFVARPRPSLKSSARTA